MTTNYSFPDNFLWGTATSAYQIEGSPTADGAGRSIWHRFSHTPGNTWLDQTGDIACDHYRRYKDDVAIMAELGTNAYRFSVAWGRIYPKGTRAVNKKGIDFYSRLVDELLKRGIEPNVTLYHWDLPETLDDRGGWLNRDIAEWFCDYAVTMWEALGDRVEMWSTLNEPWVITHGGYLSGVLAPGHSNLFEAPIATHNLLRAHGLAVERFRSTNAAKKLRGKIGITVNLEPKYPASQSPEDLDATRRADAYMNRQYPDPVFLGSYPEEMHEIFGEAWPEWSDEDMRQIKQPIDFVGINYYTRKVERYHPDFLPLKTKHVPQADSFMTDTHWEVFPEALTRALLWVTERYGRPPIYITENGASFYYPPHAINGRVEDPLRVEYYRQHLRAAHDAM